MEMVQGTALNGWLAERGPLPLDQLVPFFERVAEVVQTAHERGIVHRDLKPGNVMVIERAGRLLPKLLDFGIAKLLDDASPPEPSRTAHDDEITGRQGRRPPSSRSKSSEAATQTGQGSPPARGPPQR